MADSNSPGSLEVGDDLLLNDWEMACFEEWDKAFVIEERRIQTETERSYHSLWSSFQNSASAVSQLYKDALQSEGISLWIPFQSAAGHITSLYKDSQELIRKSFELGNEIGHHRRNKELMSWLRKRRRTLPREDIVAFICEKPAPVTRYKPYGRGNHSRRPVEISSSKFLVTTPARDYSAENDFQPFKEALTKQGLNGSVANASVTRKPGPTGHLVMDFNSSSSERFASFTADELQSTYGSQKRIKSGGDYSMPDSPSHKRARVCGMETEEL